MKIKQPYHQSYSRSSQF